MHYGNFDGVSIIEWLAEIKMELNLFWVCGDIFAKLNLKRLILIWMLKQRLWWFEDVTEMHLLVFLKIIFKGLEMYWRE